MTKETKGEKNPITVLDPADNISPRKKIDQSKVKSYKTYKKGNSSKIPDTDCLKYNKLKKKHRYLRDEYTKILDSWELSTK